VDVGVGVLVGGTGVFVGAGVAVAGATVDVAAAGGAVVPTAAGVSACGTGLPLHAASSERPVAAPARAVTRVRNWRLEIESTCCLAVVESSQPARPAPRLTAGDKPAHDVLSGVGGVLCAVEGENGKPGPG
jgi:hypothetical protein